jgi:carboxyl-terminal processing protease
MQNPTLLLRALVLLLSTTAWLVAPVPTLAQVRIPQASMLNVAQLEEAILQGRTLEQEHRWADALVHYEDALRKYPGRSELEQRLAVARTHLDIARRYGDHSFVSSLTTLDEQQALDLYAEVLEKVEAYFVDEPDWEQLVERGIANLRIATTEPAFVDRYPQPVSTDYMQSFSSAWKNRVISRSIQSRQQACDAAVTAAHLAARYLGVPVQVTILEFTCGAVSSLDHYSAYLTGDQLDEVFSQIEGNFVGLGIELKPTSDSLLIVSVIPNGPAEMAGLLAGDRILEVDGQAVRAVTADTAADMLKGPELSFVEVLIQSPRQEPRRVRIQRRQVEVPSIQDSQIVDSQNGIAYFKLVAFQKTTSRDMDAALWQLHRQGMRVLIIDLRDNPGGLLNAAVDVADKFLSEGTIVSTRGRRAGEDFDYRAHQVGTWRVPLIVLINHDSASASEILAGAIQDHRRGTIVGETSYGKGSVQGIFPLSRFKSGIRLTTAKFYSPNGRPISHHGIGPNLAVREPARQVAAKVLTSGEVPGSESVDDPVLNAAIDLAVRGTRQAARSASR